MFSSIQDNSMNFDSPRNQRTKFVFILSNETASITVQLASFIWNAFKAKGKALIN